MNFTATQVVIMPAFFFAVGFIFGIWREGGRGVICFEVECPCCKKRLRVDPLIKDAREK